MSAKLSQPTKSKPNRVNRRRLGCLAAVVLFFGFPACKLALLTPPAESVSLPPLPTGKSDYLVSVVTYGYHSAIFVEQPEGWTLGPPGQERAHYLEFGMGDREFYGKEDHSVGVMLAAAFWGTPAVVYVGASDTFPPRHRSLRSIYQRKVSGEMVLRLLTTLEQSIVHTPDGKRGDPLPARVDVKGRFYPAREYYIFWSDCNRWTVERLHQAGLAKSGIGVLTNDQIAGQLEDFRPVAD